MDDELATLHARYLRSLTAAGCTPKTLDWHHDTFTLFVRYLRQQKEPVALVSLHPDTVRGWVLAQQQAGRAQKTCATRVKALKAFASWLNEEEYTGKNLLARLRVPKVDDAPKDILTPEDVVALLRTCNRRTVTGRRDYALMLLLYSTGLRAAELLALTPADIDKQQGLLTVKRGKGGKFRQVPLAPQVERAIAHYLRHPHRLEYANVPWLLLTDEGQPLTYAGLNSLLRRHMAWAGIRANAHKWRHSAAVQYLRNHGQLETLRLLLGHADYKTTLHYARLAGLDVQDAHLTADPLQALRRP